MESQFMSGASSTTIDTIAGYASAVPTPFRNDQVDEHAFSTFCAWQIEQGVTALVVNGTTGEAPVLSLDEQQCLLRLAIAVAHGRVPVIAGVGSNSTAHAVEIARRAEEIGADGLLAVTPYYNRPPQEGLYLHFRAINDATALRVLLYDVPARTGCSLGIDTIRRLAELPRIIGLKDATGDMERPRRLRALLGERFRLLSGDDATALDFLMAGGNGCISVLSNVMPIECTALYAAWRRGDTEAARASAAALATLTAALFAESNPMPLKYALAAMGWMRADVRLPLCRAAAATRYQIIGALNELGLFPTGTPSRAAGE
jgi:4-hydroxy-tetrahydrodipicolinate synthase